MNGIRHLPVIVMTSSNAPADLEKCKQLGVSCYVQEAHHLYHFYQSRGGQFSYRID